MLRVSISATEVVIVGLQSAVNPHLITPDHSKEKKEVQLKFGEFHLETLVALVFANFVTLLN